MSEDGRYRLEDRYLADEGTVFLTGIQALAPYSSFIAGRHTIGSSGASRAAAAIAPS